jgi:hypothetical protein
MCHAEGAIESRKLTSSMKIADPVRLATATTADQLGSPSTGKPVFIKSY